MHICTITGKISILASATGGLQPKASAPKKLPANKYFVFIVLSFSIHALLKKKIILQTIRHTADTIAVQYSAGAVILYPTLKTENEDDKSKYRLKGIFLKKHLLKI